MATCASINSNPVGSIVPKRNPYKDPKIIKTLFETALVKGNLSIPDYQNLYQVSSLFHTHGSVLLFDHLNAHISINLYDEESECPKIYDPNYYRKLVIGGFELTPLTPIPISTQNLLIGLTMIHEIEIWNPVQCLYTLLRYPTIIQSFNQPSIKSLKLMLDPKLERDEDFYEKLKFHLLEFIHPLKNHLEKIEIFNGANWNPPPCHNQLIKFLLFSEIRPKINFTESLNISTELSLMEKIIGRNPAQLTFQKIILTITDDEESGRDLLPGLLENLSSSIHGLYLVTIFTSFQFPVPEIWTDLNFLTLIGWSGDLEFLKFLPSLKYLELDKLDIRAAIFNHGKKGLSNLQKFKNTFSGLRHIKEIKITNPKYEGDISGDMKAWLISTYELSTIN